MNRKRFLCIPVLLAGLLAHGSVLAQNKPTTFVVAFASGGVVDAMTRIVTKKMSEAWDGGNVIVENKAGGGTIIGTQQVVNAPSDGRTLLVTSMGYVTNPFLVKQLPYAPDALEPLALIATAPNILLLHPSVPANSVKELVALAKAKPGSITLASAGNGSSQHMAIELFSAEAGVEFVHVPYKGTAPAMNDALGGQVSGTLDSSVLALEHVKRGALKAIAVSSASRLPSASDVPTFKEAGFPAMQALTWVGVFVSRQAPAAERARLFTALQRALGDKDVQEGIRKQGFQPATVEPGSFAKFIAGEQQLWGDVIRKRKITID